VTEQMDGQVGWFDLDTWSGKTYPEPSAAENQRGRTLPPSLKKSSKSQSREPLCLCVYRTEDGQNPGAITLKMVPGALLGEYTTHSFGESPREENASRLSQILEVCPHPRYSLSAKACQGILNRAEKRGKELPEQLEAALREQAGLYPSKRGGGKPGGGKGILIQHEHVGALSTLNNQSVLAISVDEKMGQTYIGEEVGNTLAARDYKQPQAVVYGISSYDSNAMKSPNPHSGIYEADTARTLDLNGGSPACNQGGIAVLCLNDQGGSVMGVSEDVTGALRAEEHGHQPILFEPRSQDGVPRIHGDVSPTLNTAQGGQRQPCVVDTYQKTVGALCAGISKQVGNQIVGQDQLITKNAIVRRLTPLECERLQGYPDGWTNIGEWVDSKGKKHKDADSPRYKALGNSIALPFWQWMARRICAQYERTVTMASLFDGIGGFPLVFQRCGAVPVWASEIEEFPIAVTKVRFPDESV